MYTADPSSHLPEIETCPPNNGGGALPSSKFPVREAGAPSGHYWIGIPASFAHFQFLGEGGGDRLPPARRHPLAMGPTSPYP